MNFKAVQILIVEDEPAHAEAIRRALTAFSPEDEVLVAGSLQKFREAVADHSPDIAIMDMKLSDGSALEALSFPPEAGLFPIVVMTSYGNEQIAVEAMKAGAIDYVVKSPDAFTSMPRIVERAFREWRLLQQNKKAEEALWTSEEANRALLNATVDAACIVDLEGNFICLNEQTAARLGKKPEELLGTSIFSSFSPEGAAERKASLRALMQSPHTAQFEEGRNGRMYHDILYPILDDKGMANRVAIFSRDITEQRQAEQELKASLEQLRAYFYLPLIGIATTSVKKGWVDVNPKLCQMLGYEEAELRTKSWAELTPAEDFKKDQDRHARILSGELQLPYTLEKRFVKKDGAIITTEVSTDAIGGRGSDLFVAFIRDITESKQAQDAIMRERDFSQAVIDSVPGLFYVCDSELRFLRWNKNFETVTGYCAEEISRMSPVDILGEHGSEIIEEALQNAVQTGETTFEADILSKDQTRAPYFFSKKLFIMGEKPCMLVIGFDITIRKEAEDALRSSLAEKEVMLREIHHRVKNNLQVVSSLVNLQANLTKSPPVLEALTTTSNRIRSMALLHEILYSDSDLAHIDFAVYVKSLCRHIVLSFGEVAARVNIVTDISAIGMPLEKSVPCGLIINELVTNAFKHAFPDNRTGSITVTFKPFAGKNKAKGRQLLLRISDNGVGLPPGIDPLKTVSLGLKLVSTLAMQLGGTVAVERPKAGGASFSVLFAASDDVEVGGALGGGKKGRC